MALNRPLFVLLFVLLFPLAASAQIHVSPVEQVSGPKCLPGYPCNDATSHLPFVLPLFVSNANWKSTAVVVNGNSAATYVDVTVRAADGEIAVQKKIQIPGANFTEIDIGALLAEAHVT